MIIQSLYRDFLGSRGGILQYTGLFIGFRGYVGII